MKFTTVKRQLITVLIAFACLAATAKQYTATSPDGNIKLSVSDGVTFCVTCQSDTVIAPSTIALDVEGIKAATRITGAKVANHSESVDAFLYRFDSFDVAYSQLALKLGKDITLTFRVFNDGVAYRFGIAKKGASIITDETAQYNFPSDATSWLSYSTNDKDPFAMAFQNFYATSPLSEATPKLAFLPATIEVGNKKVTVLESDLEAYPGMFVKPTGNTLQGVFAPYPAKMDYYPWRKQAYVTERESYIARTDAPRQLPWRIFAITADDRQMPTNNLVYALASPSRVADTSWIKPGKVAWDWWNDWALTGVDFETGINMDTYKYYIDFAAKNGLEYIILDEGWYEPKSGDMLTTIPEINLPELIKYADSKGVGIILWTVFNVLDDQLQQACEKYSQMGIKGFKVDFLDRDDQTAVEMAYRIADACAKHKLVLDYHGYFKPTGLNRTYPNVINFEAVFGMEEARWATDTTDMPLYDVTFPYIRLMSGPVDYTPGAMRNGTRETWKAIYRQPVSMGTRAHQVASYIVHDSPLTMLADSPTAYEADMPCTSFIASLPVESDSTFILDGKMGQHIVTARKLGDNFRIGGLTNWDERDVTIDFSFLPSGKSYQATVLRDGVNAAHIGEDYKIEKITVNSDTRLPIHMAPGGGFAITLSPL